MAVVELRRIKTVIDCKPVLQRDKIFPQDVISVVFAAVSVKAAFEDPVANGLF